MLLVKDFYTIEHTESEGNEHRLTVLLNPHHEVYNGHFPGHPVVPGVCSLQMIKECLTIATGGRKFQYRTISNCKFMMMINPHVHTHLSLTITVGEAVDSLYDLYAEIKIGDGVALKLKAKLVGIE